MSSTIDPTSILVDPAIPAFAQDVRTQFENAQRDIDQLLSGEGINFIAAYSPDTTGVEDTQVLLAQAMDDAVAAGKPLIIGPGDFAVYDSTLLPSNLHLIMSSKTRIIRKYDGGAVFYTSLAIPRTNIYIRGGTILNPDPGTYSAGRPLSLYLEDSIIESLLVDGHNDSGGAIIARLVRCTLDRVIHTSDYDGGGFLLQGCEDTKIINCHCECGDDCYTVGATGLVGSSLYNFGSKRVNYVNCTGWSYNARLMLVAAARVGLDPPDLDADLVDIKFIGVTGRARLSSAVLNTLSLGVVARVDFIGCHVNMEDDDDTGGASGFTISCDDSGSGGVEDINVIGGSYLSPYHSTVNVYGPDVRRVTFRDVYLGASRGGRETIRVDTGAECKFFNCNIEGPPDEDAALIGADSGQDVRVLFDGCHFFNLAALMAGMDLISGARIEISNNRFTQADAVTTARAIKVTTGCENVIVGRNDYDDLDVAVRITWPAATNAGCRFDTPEYIVTSAAATLRTYQSGGIFILTGATNRNFNLPPAGGGQLFGGVQSGTGTFTFTASAGDVIKVGTLTSSAGGTAVSASVGATIQLVCLDDTTWQAVAYSGTWTIT